MVNEKFKQAVLDAYREKRLNPVRVTIGVFRDGGNWISPQDGRCCGIGALLAGNKVIGLLDHQAEAAALMCVSSEFVMCFEIGFDGGQITESGSRNGYETGQDVARALGLA